MLLPGADRHEEALLVVALWGRQWTREGLLARLGQLEQVAGSTPGEVSDGKR
jgi:hypothetical protein